MSKTRFIAEPGRQDIVMLRTFDAPRDRVFDAFVDPKAIPLWWGPRYLATTVERLEARHGGLWRIVQRDPAGTVYGFRGVYHDSVAPERLVRTFEFEGMPGHVAMETVVFEEVGGATQVTVTSVFQSQEDRDGMVQAGAEGGVVESWDRLEDLLRS